MKTLSSIAYFLLVIGGLNWFLIALGFGNVIEYLGTVISTTIYILVGLSSIYMIFVYKKLIGGCECSNTPEEPASTSPTQTM